jgi:hypothetical protein
VSEYVDRVVFTHDRRYDFVISASSLGGTAAEAKWDNLLRSHVRVQHPNRPRTSMWYWTGEEVAAVLWRMTSGGDGRADRCHALVGTPAALDIGRALALANWDRWDDADWEAGGSAGLSRITMSRLAEFGAARAYQSDFGDCVAVVRAFLEKPQASLSILTERWNLAQRVDLVHDLVNIFICICGENRWTFSTFETRHDKSVERLPQIVFAPPDLRSPTNSPIRRAVARLSDVETQGESPLQDVAKKVVTRYRDLGFERFWNWLRSMGVSDTLTAELRVKTILNALGSEKPKPKVPDQPPPTEQETVVDTTDVQLMTGLRTASSVEVLNDLVYEIDRRGVSHDHERARVRQLLFDEPSWVDVVCAAVKVRQQWAVAEALVKFAVDKRDWQDPDTVRMLNAVVAGPRTSFQMSTALIKLSLRHNELDRLASGIATKHVQELGLGTHEVNGLPVPSARSARPRPQAAERSTATSTRVHGRADLGQFPRWRLIGVEWVLKNKNVISIVLAVVTFVLILLVVM